MTLLVAGLLAWLAAIEVKNNPRWSRHIGERNRTLSITVGSMALILIGIALLIAGKSSAPYRLVWLPPVWLHLFVLPIMFVSAVFAAAALVRSNLRRWTVSPFAWAAVLWSVAHLLVRGDLASITLFAGCGLLALWYIGRASRYQQRSRLAPQPLLNESLTVGVAGLLLLATFYLHAAIFGVSASMMNRSFY